MDLNSLKTKAKKMLICTNAVATTLVVAATPVFASETSSTAANQFDGAALVDIVESISSLFTVYPINLFMGFGLAAAGFSLFKKAKRAAK